MRIFVVSAVAFLTLAVAGSREALAEPAFSHLVSSDAIAMDAGKPFFVGLSGGAGWVQASHPNLATQSFVGATLGMHAGYTVSPRWAVGIDFNAVEKGVVRVGRPYLYSTDSMAKPLAECNGCEEPPQAGIPAATALLFCMIGPLVEFTPFGPNGFYVGASGGFAFMQLTEYFPGIGGSLRTGYRVHVAEIFNLALEAGVRGQKIEDGSALTVYGMALFRPRF